MLGQPESLFTTAAKTIDYQFGSTFRKWFFQLVKKNLLVLLLAQFAVLLLSTCVVFVDAGQKGRAGAFGNRWPAVVCAGRAFQAALAGGPGFSVARNKSRPSGRLYAGRAKRERDEHDFVELEPGKEDNFLVANREAQQSRIQHGDTNDTLRRRRSA